MTLVDINERLPLLLEICTTFLKASIAVRYTSCWHCATTNQTKPNQTKPNQASQKLTRPLSFACGSPTNRMCKVSSSQNGPCEFGRSTCATTLDRCCATLTRTRTRSHSENDQYRRELLLCLIQSSHQLLDSSSRNLQQHSITSRVGT